MHSPIHVAAFLLAVCGLWFVWAFGIKKLCLDFFRERLFELRFELFKLGASGAVPFESDTYRSLEILFNGLLRFAHRLTAASFFAALIQNAREKKDRDNIDFSKKLALKIARMPQASQASLHGILKNVNSAVVVYITLSSLPLLLLCICIWMIRLCTVRTSVSEELSSAVEEDAYVCELRHTELVAA